MLFARWRASHRSKFNASMAAHITYIWRTVPPLNKYRARAAMEASCRHTSESLRFRPPYTPHAVAFMVMALAFHTKDPDGVGDMLNIFLFPDLSPLVGSEADLLTQKWYVILGGGTLTSFANMSLLMGKQKVAPIAEWYEAYSQLDAWAVFCT